MFSTKHLSSLTSRQKNFWSTRYDESKVNKDYLPFDLLLVKCSPEGNDAHHWWQVDATNLLLVFNGVNLQRWICSKSNQKRQSKAKQGTVKWANEGQQTSASKDHNHHQRAHSKQFTCWQRAHIPQTLQHGYFPSANKQHTLRHGEDGLAISRQTHCGHIPAQENTHSKPKLKVFTRQSAVFPQKEVLPWVYVHQNISTVNSRKKLHPKSKYWNGKFCT